MEKKIARLRRAKSTRAHIRELGVPRLSVLRTGQHLYAQLFTADGAKVLQEQGRRSQSGSVDCRARQGGRYRKNRI